MYKLLTVILTAFIISIGSVSASYDTGQRVTRFAVAPLNPVADSPEFAAQLRLQSARIAEIQRVLDTEFAAFKRKPSDLATYVYHASKLNDVPWRVLVNLMARESGFRIDARSKYGAIGIAQIVPRYWDTTARNMLDYRNAVHKSAEIIALYRKKCGGLRCALHKYNVGEGSYRKGKRAPHYVAALMNKVNV